MTTHGEARRKRPISPDGFGLEPDRMERPATSATLFGNAAPLELEIGSGKGSFLVSESRSRPGVNFLGIEYARRYWRLAGDRLRRNACANVRVVLVDAALFVRDYIQDDGLQAAHIYFPDPWPKTRHRRRRFVQADRVELLARKLAPGGRLRIVTDHAAYFRQIEKVITESSLSPVDFDAIASAGDEEIVGSNFERKYRREGRRFYVIAARRD